MRIGRKKQSTSGVIGGVGATAPSKNQNKKNAKVMVIVILALLSIAWVFMLATKAEQTVTVVMLKRDVYKNQTISEEDLMPYEMLRAEWEKWFYEGKDGKLYRRVLTWDEKDDIIGMFAAYPLKEATYGEVRMFIKSRIDNSDNALYSFPGKELIKLKIGAQDLQAFKSYLQPGDRINIAVTYSEQETITDSDGYGGTSKNKVEVFKSETVFKDIMIADLQNNRGESILDIYAGYRDLDVYRQASLDNSPQFQESVTPANLLIAVTPEEMERYQYFLNKNQAEFMASLPQRVE